MIIGTSPTPPDGPDQTLLSSTYGPSQYTYRYASIWLQSAIFSLAQTRHPICLLPVTVLRKRAVVRLTTSKLSCAPTPTGRSPPCILDQF